MHSLKTDFFNSCAALRRFRRSSRVLSNCLRTINEHVLFIEGRSRDEQLLEKLNVEMKLCGPSDARCELPPARNRVPGNGRENSARKSEAGGSKRSSQSHSANDPVGESPPHRQDARCEQ